MNERGGRKERRKEGREGEGRRVRKEGEMVFEKEQQQPRAKSREKGIGEEVVGRAEYYTGSWVQ